MLKTLKMFQSIGGIFLGKNPHAMLADDPGLGKTLQAIFATQAVCSKSNLVICPASVRLGWRQEITECLGEDPAVHKQWDIISYNGASSKEVRAQLKDKYDVVINDEFHFLKTIESQRTQSVLGNAGGLVRRGHYKWMLSGTPLLNRPRELYPVLKTLAGARIEPYNTFSRFAERFCGAYFDGYGINTKGATNLDDLAQRMKGFMLRRTKTEVLPELPPRIVTRVPLSVSKEDMRQVLEEERAIGNREAYLSPVHENYSALGDMAKLIHVTGRSKIRAAAEFIDDTLETVGKVVVFIRHRDVAADLAKALSLKGHDFVVYQGGMSDQQKKDAVERFVKVPTCRVFIGNIIASGTGINGLQHASNTVIFVELDWVPGIMSQAIDRVDRMGKKYPGPVDVYVLHVPGSLESAVLQVSDGKTKVIDRLLGNGALEVSPLADFL